MRETLVFIAEMFAFVLLYLVAYVGAGTWLELRRQDRKMSPELRAYIKRIRKENIGAR